MLRRISPKAHLTAALSALLCVALAAPATATAQEGASAAPAPARAAAPARSGLVPDGGGAARNAAVSVGNCSGVLIAPDVVMTAGHCAAGLRARRPEDVEPHACKGLRDQARLQGRAWEDPDTWHETRGGGIIRVGPDSEAPRLTRRATGYAVPKCADVTLLRLDAPVPARVARPLPVLSRATPSGRLPAPGALRHAGWGGQPGDRPPSARRGTGPVLLWSYTDCTIAAVPPPKPNGRRLTSGDSGSPLLMADGDEEIVVGLLFARGTPDVGTCGAPSPPPTVEFGSYLPLNRGAVPGTEATPIGPWLRRMVPEADHR